MKKDAFEQLHRVITDPQTPQELADALRTDICADVLDIITSDTFTWTDPRVICVLWPLVRELAQTQE